MKSLNMNKYFDTNLYICDNCNKVYTKKETLLRHISSGCSCLGQLECNDCHSKFSYRSTLLRHIKDIHGQETIHRTANLRFKCNKCSKIFNRKDSFVRHISSCFNLVKRSPLQLECAECKSKFSYRSSLLRHERNTHMHENKIFTKNEKFFQKPPFQCYYCTREFNRKDTLIRHIPTCFNREETHLPQHECNECHAKFSYSSSLHRHKTVIHKRKTLNKNGNILKKGLSSQLKCLICNTSFPKIGSIINHITSQHDVEIDHEHHYFDTLEDFFEWKKNLETSTTTSYRKINLTNYKLYSITKFICHRSGIYIPKSSDRQRKEKFDGSKKIGGYCPAEIRVRVEYKTGSCKVSFVSTHMGHNIFNKKSELRHIYVNKRDQAEFASKFRLRVPYEKIIINNDDSTGSTSSNVDNDDVDILVIDESESIFFGDELKSNTEGFEAFVSEHSSSIIYYKKRNELDIEYPLLLKNDVIVIMMEDWQVELLMKYGHNIVMVDSTHGYNFLMHTLLIVNDDNEGVEVAFAISNRNDLLLTYIFFDRIKEIVGTIETRTLMSDIPESYYLSWSEIMSVPQFWLFCSWHVREDWHQNLKKIKNDEKRTIVRNQVYKIASRLDENVFLSELNDLLNDEDPDTSDFSEYFRACYLKNVKSWAYCYRKGAYVNTNMCAEAFYKTIKKYHSRVEKIDINSCLQEVSKFFISKDKGFLRRTNKIRYKLNVMKQCHKLMEENMMEISGSHSGGWYIYAVGEKFKKNVKGNEKTAVENETNVNFVSMVENNCQQCRLYCSKCKACIHQYECSCHHSAISYNMCIHIHALCTFLQYNDSNDGTSSEVITIVDLPVEIMNVEDISNEIPEDKCLELKEETVISTTEPQNLQNIKDELRNVYENMLKEVQNESEARLIEEALESCELNIKTGRLLKNTPD